MTKLDILLAVKNMIQFCTIAYKQYRKELVELKKHRCLLKPFIWFIDVLWCFSRSTGSFIIDICSVRQYSAVLHSAMPLYFLFFYNLFFRWLYASKEHLLLHIIHIIICAGLKFVIFSKWMSKWQCMIVQLQGK